MTTIENMVTKISGHEKIQVTNSFCKTFVNHKKFSPMTKVTSAS